MTTMESIKKKLGFDPLTHQYVGPDIDYEDDSIKSPLADLSIEELDCIYQAAIKDPGCWRRS